MSKRHQDIEEIAFLGQFSFSQFIMWNDIRTRSAELEKNKAVSSLINGKMGWQSKTAVLTPRQLDETLSRPDMAGALWQGERTDFERLEKAFGSTAAIMQKRSFSSYSPAVSRLTVDSNAAETVRSNAAVKCGFLADLGKAEQEYALDLSAQKSSANANRIDEENFEHEDLESLPDNCLALGMPQEHLLWHYRSRHESLVAFSNAKFYDNKLLTFPSPSDRTSEVKWVNVPGIYDKGRTKQNRAEAEAIIAEVERRLSDENLRRDSIGIVTFSSVQQNLIDDLLSELFISGQKTFYQKSSFANVYFVL